MKSMLNLKVEVASEGGTVVRYKDLVVVVEFVAAPAGEWFEVEVYQPIETEEETGEEFWNLRLESLDKSDLHFDTEGEALMDAFSHIEATKAAYENICDALLA